MAPSAENIAEFSHTSLRNVRRFNWIDTTGVVELRRAAREGKLSLDDAAALAMLFQFPWRPDWRQCQFRLESMFHVLAPGTPTWMNLILSRLMDAARTISDERPIRPSSGQS
jgi:hypothetical protein